MQSYFILFTLPLIIFSSKLFSNNILHKTQNFCVDCKFYISDNSFLAIGVGKEFGKCKLYYDVEDNNRDFLVTGIKNKVEKKYKYCSICRDNDNMCGKQGIQFVNKKTK